MNSLIELQEMEFYAFHGCTDTEKKVGNRFIVNLWLEYDASKAAESDNIKDALNYQTAYEIVAEQMKITSSLLENVCKRTLEALFQKFPKQLITAQIDISKMAPPMGGKMKAAMVTMRLEKEEDFEIEDEKMESGFQTTMFSVPSC